ncbi:hypothetical protein BCF11_0793 [Collimonas sp. PA-H2]|uniref:hypothetical protein n=1 Tax=Collimonas sp. PA-H2 TaxID=1881062 RepID=UPI000BF692EC|nr:hypothetical protein [Collimonas sp. PA-H2]PFH08438.1 hypothetical protein BCF11_0793 [Collimonas sp. PA-H2]
MQKIRTALSALLFFGCVLLLAGCASLSTSISQFEKGDYVASVKSTISYLDEKYKKAGYDDSDERNGIRERFRIIESSYESTLLHAADREYDKKIAAYSALLQIRTLLASRSYYAKYTDLPERYPERVLRENLAGQYYLKATAAAAVKDNRQAAIGFAAAADTFQVYGPYKDAAKLAEKYKFAADNQDAGEFYKQGQDLVARNQQRSRAMYRDAGQAFYNAYTVYRDHGAYKDAQTLADKYRTMGTVVLQVSSNEPGSDITRSVLALFDLGFTRFQYQSGGAADLGMYLNTSYLYYPPKVRQYVEAVSENVDVKNQDGTTAVRTYRFNRRVVVEENSMQISLDLSVTRVPNLDLRYNEVAESRRTTISYYGDVPGNGRYGYRTEGYLMDRDQLWQAAQAQLINRLNSDNRIRMIQDDIRNF